MNFVIRIFNLTASRKRPLKEYLLKHAGANLMADSYWPRRDQFSILIGARPISILRFYFSHFNFSIVEKFQIRIVACNGPLDGSFVNYRRRVEIPRMFRNFSRPVQNVHDSQPQHVFAKFWNGALRIVFSHILIFLRCRCLYTPKQRPQSLYKLQSFTSLCPVTY